MHFLHICFVESSCLSSVCLSLCLILYSDRIIRSKTRSYGNDIGNTEVDKVSG